MTFLALTVEEAKAVLKETNEKARFVPTSSGRSGDADSALIIRERKINGEWELTFAEFSMKVKE